MSQHAGGERSAWIDPRLRKDGTHPLTFVATGSHANYFGIALYLGRSPHEGFGCDNTRRATDRLTPQTVMLPSEVPSSRSAPFAWLSFQGRWGQRLPGINNGPTGPSEKEQWTHPIEWADGLRPGSLTVPGTKTISTRASRSPFRSGPQWPGPNPTPTPRFSPPAHAVPIGPLLLNLGPMIEAMSLVDRAWPVLRPLMGYHAQVYRLTRGIVGHRFPGGPPMLLLDHVGAKSGHQRTTPLVYVEDGRDLVIVASKGGHPHHPSWYHNLLAHPDTVVQVGAQRRSVHARVASPEERKRLWPKAVQVYSGYEGYQERTQREIPLVILEPRGAPA